MTAQRIRLLVTPTAGFGVGVKEIQVFDDLACDTTITGNRLGPLTITGLTCLAEGARVVGPVTVRPGGGLIATGATIVGPVSAAGARTVQLLDTQVLGPVTVTGTTGRAALYGSRIVGPVRLVDNDTRPVAVVVAGNVVTGPLACTGNAPAPVNQGRPNSVIGPATGQCAELQ